MWSRYVAPNRFYMRAGPSRVSVSYVSSQKVDRKSSPGMSMAEDHTTIVPLTLASATGLD